MLSVKISIVHAAATIAPRVAVRGMNSRMAAEISIAPVKTSYGREAPIDAHSTPIGERFPYGSSSRISDGNGICSGMSFAVP